MVEGVLIAESLRPGTVLDTVAVHKIERVAVDKPAHGQPGAWTLLSFASSAPPERLAQQLADVLVDGAWYIDMRSAEETYVVFSGEWTSYRRGDAAGRAAALDVARKLGIPEAQLDWAD